MLKTFGKKFCVNNFKNVREKSIVLIMFKTFEKKYCVDNAKKV